MKRFDAIGDVCQIGALLDGGTHRQPGNIASALLRQLARDGGRVSAVDNHCPHIGFPLSKGSVHEGFLICHWHEARFEMSSGSKTERVRAKFSGSLRFSQRILSAVYPGSMALPASI